MGLWWSQDWYPHVGEQIYGPGFLALGPWGSWSWYWPAGWWGQVQGPLLYGGVSQETGVLSGGLWKPVFWLGELCIHVVSCLASGFQGLFLTSWCLLTGRAGLQH